VLPTISSRCQPVRFDPLPAAQLAQRLQARGIDPETATACARLSLGDGERALTLALDPELRARIETFARAPLHGRAHAEQAWRPLLDQARKAGAAAKAEVEAALAEELEYLPKKEHRRRETEFTERARRAERRAATGALEHALQLIGLWYRDLACIRAGAEELAHHSDRLDALREDAALRDGWLDAVASVNPDPAFPLLIAGQPRVSLRASTQAPRVQLDVRLFELGLNGRRRLITRGTYTLDSGSLTALGAIDVSISTQGNLWCAAPGHTLVLEVSNVDTPYIAPSRIVSVTEISNVRLDVPVRSPGECGSA
jgi:hypothetical protein